MVRGGALLGSGWLAPRRAETVLPRIAFVARNDVPFDSLAVGPVAGAGRDQTAAELATVLTDHAVGRPVLTGTRQVGDVKVGGQVETDTLVVKQRTALEGPLVARAPVTVGGPLTAEGPVVATRAPVTVGELTAEGPVVTRGRVTVGELRYTEAREHLLTVPAQAFLPEDSSMTYLHEFPGVTADGFVQMLAPVALPDGARITRLRATILDRGTSDLQVRLVRTVLGQELDQDLAAVASSGSSQQVRTFTTTAISTPMVDNAAFAYGLLARWSGGPWTLRQQVLHAVTVTYTLPGPP